MQAADTATDAGIVREREERISSAMAVSGRPSTKVERASARLIRSPLAQTVRRRDFRDPAPDCSACGSFDDVRHGLGFGET